MFQVLNYVIHILQYIYILNIYLFYRLTNVLRNLSSKNNLFSDLLKMFSFSFKATNQTMDDKSQWLVLNKNYGTGLILLVI